MMLRPTGSRKATFRGNVMSASSGFEICYDVSTPEEGTLLCLETLVCRFAVSIHLASYTQGQEFSATTLQPASHCLTSISFVPGRLSS
jgi:hypothetical protein